MLPTEWCFFLIFRAGTRGVFVVEAENFESIHNHSAFARIAGPGAAS